MYTHLFVLNFEYQVKLHVQHDAVKHATVHCEVNKMHTADIASIKGKESTACQNSGMAPPIAYQYK